MRKVHLAIAALIAIGVPLSGCQSHKAAEKEHAAKVEESGEKGILRVTLTPRASERIGIETVAIREEIVTSATGTSARKVMPYGAIMYDKKGDTWTYTNPQPHVFLRQPVAVESITGDQVVLASGPPAGTAVVTVGAAELMGAEHKYGH